MQKKALGKGLGALFPARTSVAGPGHNQVQFVPLTDIIPNRFQPRQDFPQSELDQLAQSITQSGVLQPILLRRVGDGEYELIAGERRLRAAKIAKLSSIPAIIRNSTDDQSACFSLIENIQRQDLNPIEESRAYVRLMNEFGFTQEDLAERVGKDRSSLANITRLMTLPTAVQDMVATGQLSLGHAKVLLGVEHMQTRIGLAQQIVREGLSVRQTEKLIMTTGSKGLKKRKMVAAHDYHHIEDRLRKRLGTKAVITKGQRGGMIAIAYYSDDDLTRVIELILS